jgi:hypothetical protein
VELDDLLEELLEELLALDAIGQHVLLLLVLLQVVEPRQLRALALLVAKNSTTFHEKTSSLCPCTAAS